MEIQKTARQTLDFALGLGKRSLFLKGNFLEKKRFFNGFGCQNTPKSQTPYFLVKIFYSDLSPQNSMSLTIKIIDTTRVYSFTLDYNTTYNHEPDNIRVVNL